MKARRLFLWAASLLLPIFAQATSVKWLVKPIYDDIGFYSENLFKCVKNGKVQLINFEGKAMLPFAVDSVTDYSDGYALLLEKEGKKWRVSGVFGEQNHDCHTVSGAFYTERYTYCSEGFISVADAKGRQGYIDVTGYAVIRCKFREARPFRQGWASVSEKEGKAHYIDPEGFTLYVEMQLTDASSFNSSGLALVGNYQKLLIINTNGEVVKKYKLEEEKEFPVRAYDYVYDENWASFRPQCNRHPKLQSPYKVIAKENLYGYASDNQTLLVPQFEEVKNAIGDLAVVRMGQKWGIISFIEGDFYAYVEPTEIYVVPGKAIETFVYRLIVPEALDSIEFLLDGGDGEWLSGTFEGSFEIPFKPIIGPSDYSCTIRSAVVYKDLFLWGNETVLPVRRAEVDVEVGQPVCTSSYANENDIQRAKAVVTNNSAFPVEVETMIEAVLPPNSKNKVVSKSSPGKMLQPDESLECVIAFRVVEEEKVNVVVSASQDGKQLDSREAVITLRPFY